MAKSARNISFILIFLISLNVIAHFLPFERASIGNDDYAFLAIAKELTVNDILQSAPRQPDRPLAFLFLMLQEKILGNNPHFTIFLVLFSTSLVLVVVFFLLRALFGDITLATIGSAIFCLLPNKLQVYHIPAYVFMDVANFLCLLSFIFVVYYVKNGRRMLLVLSLCSYAIAIFLYETGFFLPIVLAVFIFLYKKGAFRSVYYYLFPSIFYVAFKFTNAFGLGSEAPLQSHAPSLSSLPVKFLDLFHQYFGRYMVRNFVYGAYKFPSIEQPWLVVIVVSNIVLLLIVTVIIKRAELAKVDSRLLPLSAVIFISCLIPIFIEGAGGVGGRHLVLPSIGVSIFGVWFLEKIRRRWRIIFVPLVLIALVVCQGNAWTQVIACRINRAVYETMKERVLEIIEAENVVIDTKSFADNIPFTWIQRDYNVLNTYYGAQAFETWGLSSMMDLATRGFRRPADTPSNLYIAVTNPRKIGNNFLEFSVFDEAKYRFKSRAVKRVNIANTAIVDFERVFGKDFNNGVRKD